MRFFIGDFLDGNILEELTAVTSVGNVGLDIFADDSAEIQLPTIAYSNSFFNNLNETFNSKILVIANRENTQILFAGPITKTAESTNQSIYTIQASSLNEYLKARYVGNIWGPVTNPELKEIFEASTWTGVMSEVITSAFNSAVVPAGAPQPPNIIGSIPGSTGAGKKAEAYVSNPITYYDLLREIGEDLSAAGYEWQFKPAYTNAYSKVVWDVEIGTPAEPQINSNTTMMLNTAEVKLIEAEELNNSEGWVSKIIIQSKDGDESARQGADYTPTWLPATGKPLFETYYNVGQALTPESFSEQLTERVADCLKNDSEIKLTLAQKDLITWKNNLGKMVQLTGTGLNSTLRLTGLNIDFTGSVELVLQTKKTIYPRPVSASDVGTRKTQKDPKDNIVEYEPPPWDPGDWDDDSSLGPLGSGGYGGIPADGYITETAERSIEIVAAKTTGVPWYYSNMRIVQNETNYCVGVPRTGVSSTMNYTPESAPTYLEPIERSIPAVGFMSFWVSEGEYVDLRQSSFIDAGDFTLQWAVLEEMHLAGVDAPPTINPLFSTKIRSVTLTPLYAETLFTQGYIIVPVTYSVRYDYVGLTGSWANAAVYRRYTVFTAYLYDFEQHAVTATVRVPGTFLVTEGTVAQATPGKFKKAGSWAFFTVRVGTNFDRLFAINLWFNEAVGMKPVYAYPDVDASPNPPAQIISSHAFDVHRGDKKFSLVLAVANSTNQAGAHTIFSGETMEGTPVVDSNNFYWNNVGAFAGAPHGSTADGRAIILTESAGSGNNTQTLRHFRNYYTIESLPGIASAFKYSPTPNREIITYKNYIYMPEDGLTIKFRYV